MTPIDILLKLVGFAIEKAQQGQMDEMKEALTKVFFELEKRKEIEQFNHDELIKLRAEMKHLMSVNASLREENNILKKHSLDQMED